MQEIQDYIAAAAEYRAAQERLAQAREALTPSLVAMHGDGMSVSRVVAETGLPVRVVRETWLSLPRTRVTGRPRAERD